MHICSFTENICLSLSLCLSILPTHHPPFDPFPWTQLAVSSPLREKCRRINENVLGDKPRHFFLFYIWQPKWFHQFHSPISFSYNPSSLYSLPHASLLQLLLLAHILTHLIPHYRNLTSFWNLIDSYDCRLTWKSTPIHTYA